jgi:hypothetical protein
MEVVEEPLGGGRDECAMADVFGERAIGMREDALVVAQARVDAARAAAARIGREVGREGERPLFEPLGAERFFAKWLMAGPNVRRPRMKKQTSLA